MDDWDFGLYCTHPTEYWINPLGIVLIGLLIACLIYFRLSQNNTKEDGIPPTNKLVGILLKRL